MDLKLPGYEREVVEGLRERGLVDRALISSHYPESLDLVRELAPGMRRGWSVPACRRDYTKSRLLAVPAYAVLQLVRAGLPGQAARAIASGRVRGADGPPAAGEPRAGGAVHGAGGQLYVWTVDDAERSPASRRSAWTP